MYRSGILYAQFAQMSRHKDWQQIHKAQYNMFNNIGISLWIILCLLYLEISKINIEVNTQFQLISSVLLADQNTIA